MSAGRNLSALQGEDISWPLSELPSAGQRWTVRRKAAVIDALRGGWLPVENACQLYDLSIDEILACECDIDRYGVPGLRSTRLQIYRDTNKVRQQPLACAGLTLSNVASANGDRDTALSDLCAKYEIHPSAELARMIEQLPAEIAERKQPS